ncbi:ACP S-malonyltransferase [Paenibacillus sp. JCM 10914]|uniref:ACP S-malonyltransferase n=1 Tax=Paenibacillus sp. JCM 10914 TaxID=1236974 RepID=UPI0003CCA4D3|nr:ACP S-malonyltransferase [Paenibacillus sp. JCM 10914]GAE09907.1 malonyl CoA-acyl carrier protein transacylase [Paenibacillus sp. JCM 10914]
MGKTAFIFPGQGAQSVGMGKDVFDALPSVRAIYQAADHALGFPLSSMVFNGPDADLKQTANTQPALLATSMAYLEAITDKGLTPDYVAGHSLGEYSALVCAGVLSFEEAVTIVRARGEYMEAAVPGGQGAMAAVLGAEREALAELCQTITDAGHVVELANMNCPGQIVISGSAEGVAEAAARVKEAGGKRAIPLEVSGPFHSSLMKGAADRLADKLEAVTFKNPEVSVVANVTARPVDSSTELRDLLVEQVYSPVLWQDSVEWMIGQGVDTFIEIGPGSVLGGLIKKIDRSVKVIQVNSLDSVNMLESVL